MKQIYVTLMMLGLFAGFSFGQAAAQNTTINEDGKTTRKASDQEQGSALLKRYIKIEGRFKAPTWSAVHMLADHHVPIGFEASAHLDIDNDTRVVLKSGTLEDILDSMIEQDMTYTWEEVDGVINVFPSMDRDKMLKSLLESKIGPMSIPQGDDRVTMTEMISSAIEREGFPRIYISCALKRSDGLPKDFGEQLDIPAADLRTALNEIVKHLPWKPRWAMSYDGSRKTVNLDL